MSTAIITLPWIDGFELSSNSAIGDRYLSAAVSIHASGRTGQAVDTGGGLPALYLHFASETTMIVGIARYMTNYSQVDFLALLDSAQQTQFTVRQKGDGTLALYRGDPAGGGTLLATSNPITQVLLTGFWAYIELKVTVDNSVGAYELRVNEQTWLSATGVDTQQTANANVGYVSIVGRATNGGTPTDTFVDDFYISGGSISSPLNTFWGNQKIEMLRPNGPGTYSQFSRGGTDYGSNYREVQERAQDGDATYVEYATAGGKDSYVLYDMAGTPSEIRYLQGSMYARKQDTLDRENQFLLIAGGSEYLTCSEVLSTSYAFYKCGWQTDPGTGLPWNYAGTRGINNLELGSRVSV